MGLLHFWEHVYEVGDSAVPFAIQSVAASVLIAWV